MELVSDPAILATQGDGVLLVLDAQPEDPQWLRPRSVRSLEAVGANVMNNVKAGKGGCYGGYTYDSYRR